MANGQPKNNKNKLVQDLLKKSGAKAYGEKEAQKVLDYYEGDVDQVISEVLTRTGKEVDDETIGKIKDYYGITQESADTAAQEPLEPPAPEEEESEPQEPLEFGDEESIAEHTKEQTGDGEALLGVIKKEPKDKKPLDFTDEQAVADYTEEQTKPTYIDQIGDNELLEFDYEGQPDVPKGTVRKEEFLDAFSKVESEEMKLQAVKEYFQEEFGEFSADKVNALQGSIEQEFQVYEDMANKLKPRVQQLTQLYDKAKRYQKGFETNEDGEIIGLGEFNQKDYQDFQVTVDQIGELQGVVQEGKNELQERYEHLEFLQKDVLGNAYKLQKELELDQNWEPLTRMSSAWNRLTNTLIQTGMGAPVQLTEGIATIMSLGDKGIKALSEAYGIDEDTEYALRTAYASMTKPPYLTDVRRTYPDIRAEHAKISEFTDKQMLPVRDRSFLEDPLTGAYEGALGFIPSLAVGFSTSGVGFVPWLAGMESLEMAKKIKNGSELDYSEIYDDDSIGFEMTALTIGVASGMLEKWGFKKMSNFLLKTLPSTSVVREVLVMGGQQSFINWLEAGLTEYGGKYADLKAKNPEMDETDLQTKAIEHGGKWLVSEEGLDAGLKAGFGSLLMGGPSTLISYGKDIKRDVDIRKMHQKVLYEINENPKLRELLVAKWAKEVERGELSEEKFEAAIKNLDENVEIAGQIKNISGNKNRERIFENEKRIRIYQREIEFLKDKTQTSLTKVAIARREKDIHKLEIKNLKIAKDFGDTEISQRASGILAEMEVSEEVAVEQDDAAQAEQETDVAEEQTEGREFIRRDIGDGESIVLERKDGKLTPINEKNVPEDAEVVSEAEMQEEADATEQEQVEDVAEQLEEVEVDTEVSEKQKDLGKRMNDAEYIDEAELNEQADNLYELWDKVDQQENLSEEQKEQAKAYLETEIEKIESYELATTDEVIETPPKKTAKGLRIIGRKKRGGTTKFAVTPERFEGQQGATVTDSEGNEQTGQFIAREDGRLDFQISEQSNQSTYTTDGGNEVSAEKAEDGNWYRVKNNGDRYKRPVTSESKIQELESNAEQTEGDVIPLDQNRLDFIESVKDDQGNVMGAVMVDNSTGNRYNITDSELALDLAIKAKQMQLGEIYQNVFEEVYEEVASEPTVRKRLVREQKAEQEVEDTEQAAVEQEPTEQQQADEVVEAEQEAVEEVEQQAEETTEVSTEAEQETEQEAGEEVEQQAEETTEASTEAEQETEQEVDNTKPQKTSEAFGDALDNDGNIQFSNNEGLFTREDFAERDRDAKGQKVDKDTKLPRNFMGKIIKYLLPSMKANGISVVFHKGKDSMMNAIADANNGKFESAGGFINVVERDAEGNPTKMEVHVYSGAKNNTATHEFFHPIVTHIFKNNNEAFGNLVASIQKSSSKNATDAKRFIEAYRGDSAGVQANELVTEALASEAIDAIADLAYKSQSLFRRWVDAALKALGINKTGRTKLVSDLLGNDTDYASFGEALGKAIFRGDVLLADPILQDNINFQKEVYNEQELETIEKGDSFLQRLTNDSRIYEAEYSSEDVYERLKRENQEQYIESIDQRLGEEDGKGTEALVWAMPDTKSVTKALSYDMEGSLGELSDKIIVHNSVFPATPIDVIALSTLSDGTNTLIVDQPFVDFDTNRPLSKEEIISFMEGLGFEAITDEQYPTFSNGRYEINDLHEGNIGYTKGGNIAVVDMFADIKRDAAQEGPQFQKKFTKKAQSLNKLEGWLTQEGNDRFLQDFLRSPKTRQEILQTLKDKGVEGVTIEDINSVKDRVSPKGYKHPLEHTGNKKKSGVQKVKEEKKDERIPDIVYDLLKEKGMTEKDLPRTFRRMVRSGLIPDLFKERAIKLLTGFANATLVEQPEVFKAWTKGQIVTIADSMMEGIETEEQITDAIKEAEEYLKNELVQDVQFWMTAYLVRLSNKAMDEGMRDEAAELFTLMARRASNFGGGLGTMAPQMDTETIIGYVTLENNSEVVAALKKGNKNVEGKTNEQVLEDAMKRVNMAKEEVNRLREYLAETNAKAQRLKEELEVMKEKGEAGDIERPVAEKYTSKSRKKKRKKSKPTVTTSKGYKERVTNIKRRSDYLVDKGISTFTRGLKKLPGRANLGLALLLNDDIVKGLSMIAVGYIYKAGGSLLEARNKFSQQISEIGAKEKLQTAIGAGKDIFTEISRTNIFRKEWKEARTGLARDKVFKSLERLIGNKNKTVLDQMVEELVLAHDHRQKSRIVDDGVYNGELSEEQQKIYDKYIEKAEKENQRYQEGEIAKSQLEKRLNILSRAYQEESDEIAFTVTPMFTAQVSSLPMIGDTITIETGEFEHNGSTWIHKRKGRGATNTEIQQINDAFNGKLVTKAMVDNAFDEIIGGDKQLDESLIASAWTAYKKRTLGLYDRGEARSRLNQFEELAYDLYGFDATGYVETRIDLSLDAELSGTTFDKVVEEIMVKGVPSSMIEHLQERLGLTEEQAQELSGDISATVKEQFQAEKMAAVEDIIGNKKTAKEIVDLLAEGHISKEEAIAVLGKEFGTFKFSPKDLQKYKDIMRDLEAAELKFDRKRHQKRLQLHLANVYNKDRFWGTKLINEVTYWVYNSMLSRFSTFMNSGVGSGVSFFFMDLVPFTGKVAWNSLKNLRTADLKVLFKALWKSFQLWFTRGLPEMMHILKTGKSSGSYMPGDFRTSVEPKTKRIGFDYYNEQLNKLWRDTMKDAKKGRVDRISTNVFKVAILTPLAGFVRAGMSPLIGDAVVSSFSTPFNQFKLKYEEYIGKDAPINADFFEDMARSMGDVEQVNKILAAELEDLGYTSWYKKTRYSTKRRAELESEFRDNALFEMAEKAAREHSLIKHPSGLAGLLLKNLDKVSTTVYTKRGDSEFSAFMGSLAELFRGITFPFLKVTLNMTNVAFQFDMFHNPAKYVTTKAVQGVALALDKTSGTKIRENQAYQYLIETLNPHVFQDYEYGAEGAVKGPQKVVNHATRGQKVDMWMRTASAFTITSALASVISQVRYDDDDETYYLTLNEDSPIRITGDGHRSYYKNKSVSEVFKPNYVYWNGKPLFDHSKHVIHPMFSLLGSLHDEIYLMTENGIPIASKDQGLNLGLFKLISGNIAKNSYMGPVKDVSTHFRSLTDLFADLVDYTGAFGTVDRKVKEYETKQKAGWFYTERGIKNQFLSPLNLGGFGSKLSQMQDWYRDSPDQVATNRQLQILTDNIFEKMIYDMTGKDIVESIDHYDMFGNLVETKPKLFGPYQILNDWVFGKKTLDQRTELTQEILSNPKIVFTKWQVGDYYVTNVTDRSGMSDKAFVTISNEHGRIWDDMFSSFKEEYTTAYLEGDDKDSPDVIDERQSFLGTLRKYSGTQAKVQYFLNIIEQDPKYAGKIDRVDIMSNITRINGIAPINKASRYNIKKFREQLDRLGIRFNSNDEIVKVDG